MHCWCWTELLLLQLLKLSFYYWTWLRKIHYFLWLPVCRLIKKTMTWWSSNKSRNTVTGITLLLTTMNQKDTTYGTHILHLIISWKKCNCAYVKLGASIFVLRTYSHVFLDIYSSRAVVLEATWFWENDRRDT